MHNLTEYILLLMRSKATNHTEEVLATFTTLLAEGTVEGEQLTAAKAALSTLMSQGLSKNKPETYAKDILPQEAVDSLQKEHAAISESFITLESMFDVFGWTNVLEMEATAALHDLLEKPLPYMLACKPCSEFLKAAKAKLLKKLRERLEGMCRTFPPTQVLHGFSARGSSFLERKAIIVDRNLLNLPGRFRNVLIHASLSAA